MKMAAVTFWTQPIYQLESHAIIGHEWLTRWDGDATAGPLWAWAAQHQVIAALEAWILDQLSAWRQQQKGPPGVWFANLHPSGIAHTMMSSVERWQHWLHHLDPVVLELLEAPGWQHEILEQLTRFQATLALDDWGDHGGAVTRLVQWPVRWIKIDGALAQDLSHPGMQQWVQLVQTYVAQTQRHLILEGIETSEQWAIARQLHIPFGQGFFLARPQPWKTVDCLALEGEA